MKITFKNVGQGDSIVLEWLKNGEPRVGIVDCNVYQKTNPTIQHLQKVGCIEIDFIILSHPHEDHFSGMLELLEYCEMHNIPITTFGHTAAALHPRYLSYANIRESDQVLLDRIIIKAKSLYNKKLIRLLGAVNQNMTIKLNHDFTLKVLSPSLIEFEKFTKEIDFYNDNGFVKCSKAANYLSSVIKIYSKESACLLTSDAEKSTFKRLKQRHTEEFEDNFSTIQIPHHGSKSNHQPLFWSNIKRTNNCVAAVSAGTQYGHPSKNVISDFTSWGYKTFCTNKLKMNEVDNEDDLVFEIS